MQIATRISLILVTILIVLLRLLFTFSYETLIPLEMGFGIYLFFSSNFILYLIREIYFSSVEKTSVKKFSYIYLPAIISFAIGLVIIFNFPVDIKVGGGSDMPTGGWVVVVVVYLFLLGVTVAMALLLLVTADTKYYKVINGINESKKNIIPHVTPLKRQEKPFFKSYSAIILSTILIVLISYVSLLIYSDYSTTGIKNNYTSESNRNAIYKKAREEQDITYCDYITGVNSNEQIREGCYSNFFKELEVITQLIENIKLAKKSILRNRKSEIKDFFVLYKKLANEQCQRAKKETLCRDSLLRESYQILKMASGKKVVYEGEKQKTPKYLLFTISNTYLYKNMGSDDVTKYSYMRNLLIDDLEGLISSSIVSVKKPSRSHGVLIYIDIKNMIKSEADLFAIEKIISARERKFEEIFERKVEMGFKKQEQRRKKRILIENQKYEASVRNKYRLKRNEPIELKLCDKNRKYDKWSRVVSTCINGELAYDTFGTLYEFFDEHQTPYKLEQELLKDIREHIKNRNGDENIIK